MPGLFHYHIITFLANIIQYLIALPGLFHYYFIIFLANLINILLPFSIPSHVPFQDINIIYSRIVSKPD